MFQQTSKHHNAWANAQGTKQPTCCWHIDVTLSLQDSLITTYRDHCHNLTRGGSVYDTMAELFGRATGTTRGDCHPEGSNHLLANAGASAAEDILLRQPMGSLRCS